VCNDAQWHNGKVNENNSHYREGDVVPFRQKLTGLTPGTTYSVTIRWQYQNTDKHAYDYITSYNATETTADPCSNAGLVCSGPTTVGEILADPTLASCTGFTGTQIGGNFTLFGGTITSLSAYGTTTCGTGNQFQSITANFTAVAANEVLAQEGLTLNDFKARILKKAFAAKSSRALVVKPQDISVSDRDNDELARKRWKVTLKFFLPPGSYATIVVKATSLHQILKEDLR